ncbi:MAG TPA: hypothetical protein VF868_04640 [Bacteroidia bacterium]|jgi:hypothetical protein
MKKMILSITLVAAFYNLEAQVKGKDTVKPDSTHLEKIKKMPMDTMDHQTPVKPVPQDNKKKDEKNNDAVITPGRKK